MTATSPIGPTLSRPRAAHVPPDTAPFRERPRLGRIAAVLAIAAFLAVALTIDDLGITWDEPEYLVAARLHVSWIAAVPAKALAGDLASWTSPDTLQAYWRHNPYNNPHPPFYKVLSGATWAAFHPWLGDFPAFRLSSAALFGVLVAVLSAWGAGATGRISVGVGAALSLALMPRVFGDAHIAATDMPLTALWGLGAWLFWRAARLGSRSAVLLFGVVWGMALATKFTGLFLPVPLTAWALVFARRRLAWVLAPATVVAFCVMILLTPDLWPDPVLRYRGFLAMSASRETWVPIWTYYLGRVYPFVLPWHHALALTAVTVPLPILLLAGAGALRLGETAARPLVALCLIQVAFYQILMALPASPGHDGVRLFLPQFPFLALLAGLGFGALAECVGQRATAVGWAGPRPPRAALGLRPALGPRSARAALFVLLFGPPLLALTRVHPHELAYYNELVGGPRGAYARGFESTYWFDAATPGFLRRVERELPPAARVWAQPAPWHFTALQAAGLLRNDLAFTDSLPAPYLLLMTRQGLFRSFEWRLHRNVPPLVAERVDGVPLAALYRWE